MRCQSVRRFAGIVSFVGVVFALGVRTSRRSDFDVRHAIHSCTTVPEPCEALATAERVFEAEVLGTTTGPAAADRTEDPPDDVRFRMIRVFKGQVTTASDEWSGRFLNTRSAHRFTVGEYVLVYATRRSARTWDTACSRTRAFSPSDAARLRAETRQLTRCRSRL